MTTGVPVRDIAKGFPSKLVEFDQYLANRLIVTDDGMEPRLPT